MQVWESYDLTQRYPAFLFVSCHFLDITGSIYCVIPEDPDHVSMYILPFALFLYRVIVRYNSSSSNSLHTVTLSLHDLANGVRHIFHIFIIQPTNTQPTRRQQINMEFVSESQNLILV